MTYLAGNLKGMTEDYRLLVAKTYLKVVPVILTKAQKHLFVGIFHSLRGKREHSIKEFLQGSQLWGEAIKKMTSTNLIVTNRFEVPEKGHMIFLNHVNELDFPFDCLIIAKPFLANQHIKNSYFAYWWMKAMGSQVFDNSKTVTIAVSVKSLVEGLETTSFIVYPEGHNSYSEEIQPLKKGMIKIAFDKKIPVFLAVKSGITKLQSQQKGNTIGYQAIGITDPKNFDKWESFRDHIFESMQREKRKLDETIGK